MRSTKRPQKNLLPPTSSSCAASTTRPAVRWDVLHENKSKGPAPQQARPVQPPCHREDVVEEYQNTEQRTTEESGPISLARLAEIDFPEPEMVIEDVLPVGVHLLVGKPKKGKSWMSLGMCEAVSTGGKAFGVKGVREGIALYLALEDTERRLLKRARKV